jgi:3'(2'), 5'-bisphosphate nucleotidase
MHGTPLDFTHGRLLEANTGVVATNGPVHDAVLEALAAATA